MSASSSPVLVEGASGSAPPSLSSADIAALKQLLQHLASQHTTPSGIPGAAGVSGAVPAPDPRAPPASGVPAHPQTPPPEPEEVFVYHPLGHRDDNPFPRPVSAPSVPELFPLDHWEPFKRIKTHLSRFSADTARVLACSCSYLFDGFAELEAFNYQVTPEFLRGWLTQQRQAYNLLTAHFAHLQVDAEPAYSAAFKKAVRVKLLGPTDGQIVCNSTVASLLADLHDKQVTAIIKEVGKEPVDGQKASTSQSVASSSSAGASQSSSQNKHQGGGGGKGKGKAKSNHTQSNFKPSAET